MKKTLLLLLLFALASAVAQAGPCLSGKSLASYIALGAGGCTFDSLVFSNFQYTNPADGGAVSPSAGGVVVNLVPGVEKGLQFVGDWLATSGQLSDGNISYSVTCDGCLIDDLELDMTGLGILTGVASVVETATSSSGTVGLGTASADGIDVFKATKDITPTDSLDLTKDIGASGGTAGVGHVSGVFNLFSTNQTTMTPEPSLGLLCLGALCLLPVARKVRRA